MKKILVLFLMLFGVGQVSALEYSDYSEFSEYTDRYIQSDDLTDVKVERRYKYYKFEKELGGYGEDTTLDYPYIDKEDFIYTDYSNLSLDKPLEKEGRVIEEINGYHYKKIKDINYITLEASMADLTLDNIKVLYNDAELDYEIETKSVNGNTINQCGYIKLKFNDLVDISKITLTYDTKEKSNRDGSIIVRIGNDDVEYGYSTVYFVENKFQSWSGMNADVYLTSFEDYYSEIELETGKAVMKLGEETLYKYKDILYRNYNLNKIYYNEYLTMPYEDYIYMDESLYKDYYAKRVRTILPEVPEVTNEVVTAESGVLKNNNQNSISVLDKTSNAYEVPSRSIYYPLNINKINDLKEKDTKELYSLFFPFLLLVILILVLSKLYQKKKECVKVG